MLSREQIKDLNELMIGRGAPIERDNIGYNAPDFAIMQYIGMLNTEYTLEECYLTLMILAHYTNTQLASYSEEIKKTLEDYKEQMGDKYLSDWDIDIAVSDAKCGKGHNREDYEKEEIATQRFSDDGVYFSFSRFEQCFNPKDFNGRWIGNGQFFIPYDSLKEFTEKLGDIGYFGYKPDKKLSEFLEYRYAGKLAEITKQKEEKEKILEHEASSLVLKYENRKSAYGVPLYSLNINSYPFSQKLWEGKGVALSYVDTKTDNKRTIVSVKDSQLEEFKKLCDRLGIDYSCIIREEEKKKNWNNSYRSLIDVDTLSLPFKPYDFQVADAKEIVSKNRALIGHDMGCGKTFIATLVGMSIDKPKLVICPESLRLNWKREVESFDKGSDISVVYSKDKEVRFGHDWTIMGYHTASKFYKEILGEGIDCVFIDEAHNCKAVNNFGNPASKRAEAVLNISLNAKNCYLLTGTPMPTRNKDLYNTFVMLGLIDRETPYAFHNFGTTYCDAFNNGFGWDYNGSSNTTRLHEELSSIMTRRLKSEVLPDLKKHRQFIPLEGTSREYKKVEKQIINNSDDNTYMALAMTGRRLLSDIKVPDTIDLAESFLNSGESVVIVTEFNDTMDRLIEHFGDNACYIRGGMSDKSKQQAVDDFQSGNKKICILNLIAGKEGLTLTKAHNMIICDYDWTPGHMSQVEDRICRSGQTKGCNIYYLYCEDALLDRLFVEMITNKSSNIDLVIDDAENTVDLKGASNNRTYIDALKNAIEKQVEKQKEISKKQGKKKSKTNIEEGL